jgi:ketopantoate reductase
LPVAGRRLELDALNGYVATRSAALGLDAPMNAAVYALLRRAEQTRAGDAARVGAVDRVR